MILSFSFDLTEWYCHFPLISLSDIVIFLWSHGVILSFSFDLTEWYCHFPLISLSDIVIFLWSHWVILSFSFDLTERYYQYQWTDSETYRITVLMKVETDIIASIRRDSDRMSCDTLIMFFMSSILTLLFLLVMSLWIWRHTDR